MIMMIKPKIILSSVLIASILSLIGIIRNDNFLLLAGIIVSPMAIILNNVAKDMVMSNSSYENLIILITSIVMAVVVGFIGGKTAKYIESDIDESKIKVYRNTNFEYHSFLAFILGVFMVYLMSFNEPNLIIGTLVGISIVVILLVPLVDVGLRLSYWYNDELENDQIWSDLKIVGINAGSFFIASLLSNYFLSNS